MLEFVLYQYFRYLELETERRFAREPLYRSMHVETKPAPTYPAESNGETDNEKLANRYGVIVPVTLLCEISVQFMDDPVAIWKNKEETVYIDRMVLRRYSGMNPFTRQSLLSSDISQERIAIKMAEINAFKQEHFPCVKNGQRQVVQK